MPPFMSFPLTVCENRGRWRYTKETLFLEEKRDSLRSLRGKADSALQNDFKGSFPKSFGAKTKIFEDENLKELPRKLARASA